MFTSNSDEWATPTDFYDKLDEEFNFTLDACASDQNHKCDRYFTKETDGLKFAWGGETVFCNPPYSQIAAWVKKAFYESKNDNTTIVMLIPARTDTQYFHNYILHRSEIRFVKGRIKFSGSKNNAPFPSMVVVFRGPQNKDNGQLSLFGGASTERKEDDQTD